MIWSIAFRVWGLGYGQVWDLQLRVLGAGFRALEFRGNCESG